MFVQFLVLVSFTLLAITASPNPTANCSSTGNLRFPGGDSSPGGITQFIAVAGATLSKLYWTFRFINRSLRISIGIVAWDK